VQGAAQKQTQPPNSDHKPVGEIMVRVKKYVDLAGPEPGSPAASALRSPTLQRALAAFTYRDFRILWRCAEAAKLFSLPKVPPANAGRTQPAAVVIGNTASWSERLR
jgi:hypothetical protein